MQVEYEHENSIFSMLSVEQTVVGCALRSPSCSCTPKAIKIKRQATISGPNPASEEGPISSWGRHPFHCEPMATLRHNGHKVSLANAYATR